MKLPHEMTTKELKLEAKGLHDSIYITECFGTLDLLIYEGVLRELEKRGYVAHEASTLTFEKEV